MLNIIIILIAFLQGILGLFVYQKKRNSITNQAFGLLTIATLIWALTNYIYTLNPVSSSALTITRFVLFFVVIQNSIFYIFAKNYPSNEQQIKRRELSIFLLLSGTVALLTVSPYIFKSVTILGDQATPNPGPLIPLFVIHALYSCGNGLRYLFKKLKKSQGQARKQLQYILFASVLNWAIVPITNFVITLVFKTSFFALVSPFYTLLFAAIIAYSIVAHHLFDIKAAVARAVTYLVTTFFLSAGYVLLAFGVKRLLLPNQKIETAQLISNIALTIVLVLVYPTLQKRFNRLTNKIFFRDSYDPQSFLDELNKILVTNLDIEILLQKSSYIIESNLKAQFCSFFIRDTAYLSSRLIGDQNARLSEEDTIRIRELLPDIPKKVINAEEEHDTPEEKELSKLIASNGSEIAVRIVSTLDYRVEGIGYFLLGPKRSGNLYTSQDIKILEIVANELVIAIENALRFEEIEQFNITLQKKIDDATKELKSSNTKLKALDQAKDEFISMASHQLRTPLTSVKGYLSMLDEGDAGKLNETQKKFVNQAFISSQRMVYLIADLLNVSRLKTGKFVIESHPMYLPDVIETEIAQLYETVKARKLTMTFDKPATFPKLNLDETKLRQVIMNFADNAIYYTRAGGEIKITLNSTPRSIEFMVKDNGIGVPKIEQHQLFTKFYRAGNARQARPDGTGLGLFMAKKVIIAQGGSLIFKSVEGKGSTFGFHFNLDSKLTDIL